MPVSFRNFDILFIGDIQQPDCNGDVSLYKRPKQVSVRVRFNCF